MISKMENLIGMFDSKDYGRVLAIRATYESPDGPTAVMLESDGEAICTLSVNMYKPEWSQDSKDLPKDCFCAKNWSENAQIAKDAANSGLFVLRADLPEARSGFVSAPVWQIVEVKQ